MKPNSPSLAALVLLALLAGIVLILFSAQNQSSAQAILAMASRDCAPWDGPAFVVSIPTGFGSMIQVSIWQSPRIMLPASFSFPGEHGNAMVYPKLGSPEQLSGSVTFQRVEQGLPITGEFNLRASGGRQFQGAFKALWTDTIVACG
jgi:hypothetical protein